MKKVGIVFLCFFSFLLISTVAVAIPAGSAGGKCLPHKKCNEELVCNRKNRCVASQTQAPTTPSTPGSDTSGGSGGGDKEDAGESGADNGGGSSGGLSDKYHLQGYYRSEWKCNPSVGVPLVDEDASITFNPQPKNVDWKKGTASGWVYNYDTNASTSFIYDGGSCSFNPPGMGLGVLCSGCRVSGTTITFTPCHTEGAVCDIVYTKKRNF